MSEEQALDELDLLIQEYDPEQSDWRFRKSVMMQLIERIRPATLRRSADSEQPRQVKTVYIKRWRTLVELPLKYADEIVEALRTAPQSVAEPSPCAYTGYVPHEGDEQVFVRIWGFGRPDASVKDVRVLYSFPPTTVPDERAIREAFDDWSWNKADGPIGGLDPISAARNGFAAGAKWGAERRAQAEIAK